MKTLILHMPSQEEQELMARTLNLPLENVAFAVQTAAMELAKGFGAGFSNPNPRTVVFQYARLILMRLQIHLLLTSHGVPEKTATAIVLSAFCKAVAAKPTSSMELTEWFAGEVKAVLRPGITYGN